VEIIKVNMPAQRYLIPIIEPGALEGPVVHSKAGDADDMQLGIRRGTKACDVAGIGRDLGFDQCNMEHKKSIF
jgi:hypothetical protein